MNLPGARLRRLERMRSGEIAADKPQVVVSSSTALTPEEMRQGQRLMITEGALWSFMNSVIIPAGVVTTAFALYLHADAFVIGLLTALPLFAALFQLWTPQIVARMGSRKQVCVVTLGLARLSLLPLALLGMAAWLLPDLEVVWLLLFLLLVTLFSAFTAVGGTSWLSWATTMIPTRERAIYFARRNTIIGLIGLGMTLLIGFFMDWWKEPTATGLRTHPAVYAVLFFIAAVFAIATIFVLQRTPDLATPADAPRPRLRDTFFATWKNTLFRRYVIFRVAWLFAAGMVLPYYAVYMLQNLQMSFTEVFILQNIGALTALLVLPRWGRVIERYGCSRVLFWTSWLKVFYVIGWALVVPGNPFWPLALLHASLLIDAGLNLASGNLLMNLMPNRGTSNIGYFSMFTAVTSLAAAIAPFLGGILIGVIAQGQFIIFGMAFGAIQVMFLLSGVLRALAMLFYQKFDNGAEEAETEEAGL